MHNDYCCTLHEPGSMYFAEWVTLPSAIRMHNGSDGSAAGGGRSDLSEWQRSADDEGASSPRKLPGTATV